MSLSKKIFNKLKVKPLDIFRVKGINGYYKIHPSLLVEYTPSLIEPDWIALDEGIIPFFDGCYTIEKTTVRKLREANLKRILTEYQMLISDGLTLREIGNILGVSRTTVYNDLMKLQYIDKANYQNVIEQFEANHNNLYEANRRKGNYNEKIRT